MLSDSTPRSLAALHARKRRVTREDEDDARSILPETPAPALSGQQMGFLFQSVEKPVTEAEAPAKPRKKERRVWSVRDLVSDLRRHIEDDYADAWVEGEISNCRLAPSGHLYFTLKDEDAQLPVVMFRREASVLKFKPCDGHAVLVRGAVSVYENRGQLQIIAKAIEPRGEGALRLAFEQLRQRLLAEGLFDQERKRPLPRFPQTLGIITSPAGAVIQDIVNIVRRRHPALHLLVFPARMQGNESSLEVRSGLAYFNSAKAPHVDLIVIARGGGSAEDLSCFNDEALARAISASDLPVVSAIGHETDFTIADFVADLRAPTPSAAAEIVTAHRVAVREDVVNLQRRLQRGARYQMLHARQRLSRIHTGALAHRLREMIYRSEQHLDALGARMHDAVDSKLRDNRERLRSCEGSLARLDVRAQIHQHQLRNATLHDRLRRAFERRLQEGSTRLATASSRLNALNPSAVLQRGYALVFTEAGNLVRNASQLQTGEIMTARVAHGELRARVLSKEDQ